MFLDYSKYESDWTLDLQCDADMVEIVAAGGSTPRIAIVHKGAEPLVQVYGKTITILNPPTPPTIELPASQTALANYAASDAERLETEILQGSFREDLVRRVRIGISGPLNVRASEVSLNASVSLNDVEVHGTSARNIQLFDARDLSFDLAGQSRINVMYATDCAVRGILRDRSEGYFAGNFLRGFEVDDSSPEATYQIRGKFVMDTRKQFFSSVKGLVN